jgi:hypothetical protein
MSSAGGRFRPGPGVHCSIWKDGRGSFEERANGHSGHEVLYERVKEASKGLGEGITLHNVRSVEVRLVVAVDCAE